MLHSICQQVWKTQQWPQDQKSSVFIPIQRRAVPKNVQTTRQLHARTVMLKILRVSLQQYMNRELPQVKAEFRKGRGTKDQNFNISWIIGKAREFQEKTYTSASLTIPKPLTMWITPNWKIFKEIKIPDHLFAF